VRPRGAPQSAGLWGIFLLVSCVFVTGCGVAASPKKGVGTEYFSHVDRALAEINVSWFYTWHPHTMRITKPDGVEFVPMIWGETFVEPRQLQLAKKSGSVLLGFNEPDRTDHANMTMQQALDSGPI
jgi:hypothetical protein